MNRTRKNWNITVIINEATQKNSNTQMKSVNDQIEKKLEHLNIFNFVQENIINVLMHLEICK